MTLKRVEIDYGNYKLIKFVEVSDTEVKQNDEKAKEVERQEIGKASNKTKQKN
ncbi:TPA: hypothetical protein [Aquificae Joseph's Coat Spring virus]|nr:TPA: hypothetical protein [Aquificae Joseph's Coat Spring virus]